MKILGIGESIMDKVYEIEKISNTDSINSTPFTKHIGGSILAALVLLSRLGVVCTFLTTIGKDENGEAILTLLEQENINVLPRYSKKTTENSIIVNTADGTREKIRGTTSNMNLVNIDKEFLQQFDAIIIDRHEKAAFYEVIKKKKSSTKVFIDTSTEISSFTMDMIKYADYPIIPIEFLGNPTNFKQNLEKTYAHSGKTIIVTVGKLGSILYDGKKMENINPLQINPVDVTGAGDIYRGGFTYGIMKGMEMRNAAEFANIVAGLQCKRLGNVSAIPSITELKTIISRIDTENHNSIRLEL